MSQIKITTLEPADYEPWSKLWEQYLTFYNSSLPETQYRNTWSRMLAPSGDIRGLVARDEQGKIIGLSHYLFLASPWCEEGYCHLSDLFVDPEIRGKGVGRALIEATAKKAAEKGCKRLQWTTKHDNYQAQKLYDSMAVSEFKQYRMVVDPVGGGK